MKPFAWLTVHPASFIKGIKIRQKILESKCFLSTLPRSGTEFITCLLTSACDLADGGNGEYYYENDDWIHNIKIVWPSTLHNFVAVLKNKQVFHENSFMIAHHPIQKANMFSIRSMKIVFTVRNIFDQLESWLLHTFSSNSAQEDFIRRGYVERTINYFNYWGDFISVPGIVADRDYVCIKYEKMVSDPLADLTKIVNLWNWDMDEAVLKSAVELCKRENMESKVPRNQIDSNKRITVRANRGKLFSAENIAYINRSIRDNLRHDFGYKY